jgi:16S rRNA (cytosine1402-N4)-methyltransferase
MTGEGRSELASVIRLVRSPSTGAVEDSYSAHFHPSRSGRQPDGKLLVEGLRMSRSFEHQPVMLDEVVELFEAIPPGLVLDATVGAGGHAEAILAAYPHLRLIGLDRDQQAVAAARARLEPWGDRAVVVHARFDDLSSISGVTPLVGALFDLGVSSAQLDIPERGFSYRQEGPLDMRMDQTKGLTAAELVNAMSQDRLVELLEANGERRFAEAITRSILAARPLQTTTQLADAVARAIPAAARRRGNPASRVFQALRTEVNAELDILVPAIEEAVARLAPGGRCVVLAYQSNEDRLVKESFGRAATGGCTCPHALGCVCGAQPWVRLLNRGARMASPAEVASNPRAAACRLRALQRLDAPIGRGA